MEVTFTFVIGLIIFRQIPGNQSMNREQYIIKNSIFLRVMPRSLVEVYRRFGGNVLSSSYVLKKAVARFSETK
jgi:hypothetical protein